MFSSFHTSTCSSSVHDYLILVLRNVLFRSIYETMKLSSQERNRTRSDNCCGSAQRKCVLRYEVIWGILVFWLLLFGGYLGGR